MRTLVLLALAAGAAGRLPKEVSQLFNSAAAAAQSDRRRQLGELANGRPCVDNSGFVNLDFARSETKLVRSNLGGVGGRCFEDGECSESGPAPGSAEEGDRKELYFSGLARTDANARVDLRITAVSPYKAHFPDRNGIKPGAGFGVINLLAANTNPSFGYSLDDGPDAFSYVELKFEFFDGRYGTLGQRPLTLQKTFLTM